MHPSIFDVFKIGIGPSSSHTMGPMLASKRFLEEIEDRDLFEQSSQIQVELYGSLALTGIGHCTDKALLLGLEGYEAESIDPDIIDSRTLDIEEQKLLYLGSKKYIPFYKQKDLIFFRRKTLPLHSNGMVFKAFDRNHKALHESVFYSIGGGIVRSEWEMGEASSKEQVTLPYVFNTGEELLKIGESQNLSIAEIMMKNEKVLRDEKDIHRKLDLIWETMNSCIERGCRKSGILPGRLNIRRRAKDLFEKLEKQREAHLDELSALDWVNLYALAVNEENASASKVVTAPTNGAAGIIPALIKYYLNFTKKPTLEGVRNFLLSAGAIGILYAKNASISGAEVGCQGEVGVACSMGAAGLAAALGGTNQQIEEAAEIGMEHNLGLTCDPIGGLVQIPCIERNAMGAIKAINAARMAMYGNGHHYVSLDTVMKIMKQTGDDMKTKYKETSRGGLSVNVPEC